MISIFDSGQRVVFKGKSGYIKDEFKGYDLLEVGKSYTVENCFRITEDRPVDCEDNWYVILVGITNYGYALDSFEPLENVRIEKLNGLLD